MSKLLWCASLTEPSAEDRNSFFPSELILLSSIHPELATNLIDCCFINDGINTSKFVDVSALLYSSCKSFVKDYDGLVLPSSPLFLSYFFFHAGIEFYTPGEKFSITILTKQPAKYKQFHELTILV